jgi:hypothetical protein
MSLITLCTLLPLPALAQGEVRITQSDGSSTTYPGVHIVDTGGTITFTLPSTQHEIVVTGAKCSRQNGLRVCNSADVWFDRYGVNEELRITKGFVFVNATSRLLHLSNSRVELSPHTLMVEILTQRGTYIVGRGWMDAPSAP